MEVGTRGIFLLIPESEKNHSAGENVVGDGAWCRNVEHGESQPDSQRVNHVPSRSNSPRRHPQWVSPLTA